MTLLTCAALAILFSLSNQEILASTQNTLKKQVQESMEDVEWEDGSFDQDSDFYDLDGGVYLSLYTETGELLYGRIPYGFDLKPDFSDGQLQTLSDSGRQWYVFDLAHRISGYGLVYIRGISSVTEAESSFRITLRFAMIVLPLLVVLTAVIGYLFTRRTLRPVRRITDTVQEIQTNQDLSRRVELGNGTDEIYQLADTFDQLLDRIERAFRREQQFTSDVSHELRTPITVILAQCDAALADETLNGEHRQQIELIEKKRGIWLRLFPSFCCSQGQIREDSSFRWNHSISANSPRWSAKNSQFWLKKNRLQSAHRLSRNCMLPQTKPFISGCLSI